MRAFLAALLIVLIIAFLFGAKFHVVVQKNSAPPDTLSIFMPDEREMKR